MLGCTFKVETPTRPGGNTRPVVNPGPEGGGQGGSGGGSGEGSGSGGGSGSDLTLSRSSGGGGGGGGGGSQQLPTRTYTKDAGGGQVQTCIESPIPEGGNAAVGAGAQEFCSDPYTPADPAAPPDPNAPGLPAAAPPPIVITPEQLAQIAVSQLEVTPPEIGITPEPGPGKMGTVGVPVWLWTPEALWEPQSVTAAVPGLSITATSQLADVTWDMGDGTSVVCDEPGIPYEPSYGLQMPDCGHVYERTSAGQPGLEYPITATARYEVTWTGAAEGSDELTASSETALPVGEYQAIVTSG